MKTLSWVVMYMLQNSQEMLQEPDMHRQSSDLSDGASCGKRRPHDGEPTAQGIRLTRPAERLQSPSGGGGRSDGPEMTWTELRFMNPQRLGGGLERLVQAVGQQ